MKAALTTTYGFILIIATIIEANLDVCAYKGENLRVGDRIPVAEKCSWIVCRDDGLDLDVSHPGCGCCLGQDGNMYKDGHNATIGQDGIMYQDGHNATIVQDGLLEVSCCRGKWVQEVSVEYKPREGRGRPLGKDFRANWVVLISGGLQTRMGGPQNYNITKSVEVFDPRGICEAYLPDLPVPLPYSAYHTGRSDHSLHYLEKTGEILLCGGGGGYPRRTCDYLINETSILYPAGKMTFRHHSNLTSERRRHSGVVAADKLWLIGGHDGLSHMSMETLAIPGKVWEPIGYDPTNYRRDGGMDLKLLMKDSRERGCSIATPSGYIIVTGGFQKQGGLVEDGQVTQYDPLTQQWKTLPPMIGGARYGHGCVHIPSPEGGEGSLLVAGGGNLDVGPLDTALIFDIDTSQWKEVNKLNEKRAIGKLVAVDGRILFFGGTSVSNTEGMNSVEEYDPVEDRWNVLEQTMKMPRANFAATAVPRTAIGC